MTDTNQMLSEFAQEFRETGTTMVPLGLLFSQSELEELDALRSQLPEEYVELGDAGEPNDLYVNRIMVDHPGKKPVQVNGDSAKRIFEILNSREKHSLVSIFTQGKAYIRRCQVNKMISGSFIGYHLDTDSNPDYLVSIVIQLGKDFDGGEFVTHKSDNNTLSFKPNFGSVIISDCTIPHEVKTVTKGERVSLVYFYSLNGGINNNSH